MSRNARRLPPAAVFVGVAAIAVAACGGGATPSPSASTSAAPSVPSSTDVPSVGPSLEGSLTIYSGRSEELVGPLIERFETETGIDVEVNYAGTSDLAATLLEEGANSPADVFFSQDGGALGALAAEGLLAELPGDTLGKVDTRFRSPDGQWVGVSGRARVVAYDPRALSEDELPDSILDFADPEWKGRIGWAPTNASLQSFITALRVLEGEDAARAWLEGVVANEPKVYEGNSQALEGVAAGEVEVALINHYYLLGQVAEQGDDYPARNHFLPGGDPGALVNVAGAAILGTAKNPAAAQTFVDFLLAEESQQYFADETFEYPLIEGVPADERLVPLADIESPDIDLSDLSDLEGTLSLMQEVGAL